MSSPNFPGALRVSEAMEGWAQQVSVLVLCLLGRCLGLHDVLGPSSRFFSLAGVWWAGALQCLVFFGHKTCQGMGKGGILTS